MVRSRSWWAVKPEFSETSLRSGSIGESLRSEGADLTVSWELTESRSLVSIRRVSSERLVERATKRAAEGLAERAAEGLAERAAERATEGLAERATKTLVERGTKMLVERATERATEMATERLFEKATLGWAVGKRSAFAQCTASEGRSQGTVGWALGAWAVRELAGGQVSGFGTVDSLLRCDSVIVIVVVGLGGVGIDGTLRATVGCNTTERTKSTAESTAACKSKIFGSSVGWEIELLGSVTWGAWELLGWHAIVIIVVVRLRRVEFVLRAIGSWTGERALLGKATKSGWTTEGGWSAENSLSITEGTFRCRSTEGDLFVHATIVGTIVRKVRVIGVECL